MFGPIIALLALFGLVVLLCFFIFVPENANKRQVSVYNWTVLGVLVMICLPFVFYIDSFLPPSRKEYLRDFAIIGCLGIEIVWLAIAFLLRNFWVFRGKKYNYF
jgi:multisubunit Na+/H+ antiporter MnhB subunit